MDLSLELSLRCVDRGMLAGVRGGILLSLLGACSFDHRVAAPADVRIDVGDPDVVIATWQTDAISKKGVPAASFEWTELLAKNGLESKQPPEHVWLMQGSTGPLVDSIGSTTLDPLNAPSYGHVIPGWSRLAVGTNDTNINQGFATTTIGNLNGTSYTLLLYTALATAPSAERSIAGIGAGADHRYVAVTSTPAFKGTGYGVTPTTGSVNPQMTVHPVVLVLNATAASYQVYTDQEKLSVTWASTTGTGALVIVGNASYGAAPARYLYGALWSGAAAEFSDLDVQKVLSGLGWTVTGF
jgi:hypothetical protein